MALQESHACLPCAPLGAASQLMQASWRTCHRGIDTLEHSFMRELTATGKDWSATGDKTGLRRKIYACPPSVTSVQSAILRSHNKCSLYVMSEPWRMGQEP